jgi:dolichol-phosphate mannosyltransferase
VNIASTLPAPRRAAALAAPAELCVVVPCYNERPNVAPLVDLLHAALDGVRWEVVFVDDDSPDGTAAEARRIATADPRVRCIRRIHRRGLASAVVEGALSSSAAYVAVMDGDLQHDERRLLDMLAVLRADTADLVVGSRYVEGGDAEGLASPWRHRLSELGGRIVHAMLRVRLSDPMSGFFMMRRPLFEALAPRLTARGFKILLDIVLSAPRELRVTEIPCQFRERHAGESKLDVQVLAEFAGLLVDKRLGGLVPLRFIAFATVGALGVLVHLAVLTAAITLWSFSVSQMVATLVAMAFNFQLNNQITYRDHRLRGRRLWRGFVLFMLVCGIGGAADIGVARVLYSSHGNWTLAGAMGAVIGVVWNYAVSATLVWRRR